MNSEGQVVEIDDVDVNATWAALETNPLAQLIDVRTQAEWAFTGYPTLESIGKKVIFVEWQSFPGKVANLNFAQQVIAELGARGATVNDDLYFLCRTGVRSLKAARALKILGYAACHNVAKGFEGALDGAKHHRQFRLPGLHYS